MWFADVAEALAATAAGMWILAAVVWIARPVLLPAGVRRVLPVAGLPILLWAAQSEIVDGVADRHGTGPGDLAVWTWFVDHRTPVATWLMKAVTTAGGGLGMTALAVTATIVLAARRNWFAAGAVAVAAAGSSVLVVVFKDLYDRARPPLAGRLTGETNPSLPSGHALTSMVVIGVVVAVVYPALRRRTARVASVAVAALAVAAIGISRLYLGVHWASDVLVGWLLGGTWLAICLTVLMVANTRTATDQGVDVVRGDRLATSAP
jgi:membrane-associated phospholipid phosphatase